MKTRLILIALFMLLFSCADSGSDTQSTSDATGDQAQLSIIKMLDAGDNIVMTAMGTSLTCDKYYPSWFKKTSEILEDRYPGQISYYNEAKGGQPSKHDPEFWGNDYAGIDYQLNRVLSYDPDIVFIEFSINDAWVSYEISPQMSRENLQEMIDAIRMDSPKGVEIVVLTMNNTTESEEQRNDISEYYQGYRDVAEINDITLIDNHKNWIRLYDENRNKWYELVPGGVHPSAVGIEMVIMPEIMLYL